MTSEDRLHWVDEFAKRMIHRAARRAPGSLAERLDEEWMADMADRPGAWSRLRFALGCRWAITIIAHEHAIPSLTSPAPVSTGRGYLLGNFPQNSPLLSRRALTFLVVASLHAAVLVGIIMGLQSKYIKVTPTSFVGTVIERRPPVDVPPPTGVTLLGWTVNPLAPPKPLDIEHEVTVGPGDAGGEGTFRNDPAQPTPPATKRVEGGPGAGFPSAEDFYPSAAIFKSEQGVGTVRACVDAHGRLTSQPTIVDSTGVARLDEAALKLAKAGSGHYRPTTENGTSVDSCYAFRIRFRLKN
jgi:TonB family protein